MAPHRERVLRGAVASEHLVQLFDEPESLALGVSDFLMDGWQRGDRLLVVARPANWAAISIELEARGCAVSHAIAHGDLVVLDAAGSLASFMTNGDPHPGRFQKSVGELVERLCEPPRGLSAYGEMVDILVAEGNFVGAERVEALWNDLSTRCSFRLLCGYSSSHFNDERRARDLRAVCCAHDSSGARSTDQIASWRLASRRAH
jgi:hypothetical protein